MLKGYIDGATRDRLFGWVRDEGTPGRVVCLLVTVDGVLSHRLLADRSRADLEAAGVGRCAFELAFRPPLSPEAPHVVAVTEEVTGEACPGSPVTVPPARSFDAPFRDFLAAALLDAPSDAEIDARIAFLESQAAALRDLRAERAALADGEVKALRLRPGWTAVAEDVVPVASRGRALMIDGAMPRTGHDAGSNAILSHAASLRRLGYAVVLAGADLAPPPDPAGMAAIGVNTRHRPGTATIEGLLRTESGMFDLVYLHRIDVAARYLALVRHHMPRARVIYAVADLHHVRFRRQAAWEDRPELDAYASWIQGEEFRVATSADAVITHSGLEAGALARALPAGRVHAVPWAVPCRPGRKGFARRSGLAMVGHFPHAPNLSGAVWLAEEIMPLVRADCPGLSCALIGSGMPDVLRRPRPGIDPVGAVPDLAAALAGVRLTVAPLLFGAGVKGKVLDSLALGVPCVCTPVAAEGIALGPALRSLVAEQAAGLAASIVRLHADAALHAACRAEGLALIRRDWTEAQVDRTLAAAAR